MLPFELCGSAGRPPPVNLRSGLPIEEIATTNRQAVAVIDLAVLMHPTTPQAFASNTPRTAPGGRTAGFSEFGRVHGRCGCATTLMD